MIYRIALSKRIGQILTCVAFLVCYHDALPGQDNDAADAQAASYRQHLKHILGFESVSNNANGDLSIQGGYVRFQTSESSSAQIPVASIQDLTTGEQDKQLGGVPMTLAKTAAPFGWGRVVSLFSHKKYDTVTLEYVDPNGGFHGAIFQLNKGEGQVLRDELKTAGAHMSRPEDDTAKQTGDQE